MVNCNYKFNNFLLGFACLFVVCAFPALSPILCFWKSTNGVMPYVLILVAILGILYEYFPNKEAASIIKAEQIIVCVTSTMFLCGDLFALVIRADSNAYTYGRVDYWLMGYVVIPSIVTLVEIVRSLKEFVKTDSNEKKNGEKIAGGNAIYV